MALRAKIDEQTADQSFLAKLRTFFEERFRYDEKGVPRVWTPSDDIDGAFQKAKDETLELVPLYSKIAPIDNSLTYTLPSEPSDSLTLSEEDFDFPATLTIFTETKALDLTARFRKDADAFYVEAKRSTVSSVAQIPYWMYGMLVVLGWNEAMVVLFNPLYFAFLMVIAATGYVMLHLGLMGPALQVTRTMAKEVRDGHPVRRCSTLTHVRDTSQVQKQVENRLREHFAQPISTQPVPVHNRTRSIDDEDHDMHREQQRYRANSRDFATL